jgi:hypothetical protein
VECIKQGAADYILKDHLSALAVPLPDRGAEHSLQEQVQGLAVAVTEMVRKVLGGKQSSGEQK